MYFPWYRKDKMLTMQSENVSCSCIIALFEIWFTDQTVLLLGKDYSWETPSLGIHTSEPDWSLRRSTEFNSATRESPAIRASKRRDSWRRPYDALLPHLNDVWRKFHQCTDKLMGYCSLKILHTHLILYTHQKYYMH